MKERSAIKRNPGWGDGGWDETADATGFQRVGLMEDGFRRSLGLGLWISKDGAWWTDLIGGSLRLGLWIPKAKSDD